MDDPLQRLVTSLRAFESKVCFSIPMIGLCGAGRVIVSADDTRHYIVARGERKLWKQWFKRLAEEVADEDEPAEAQPDLTVTGTAVLTAAASLVPASEEAVAPLVGTTTAAPATSSATAPSDTVAVPPVAALAPASAEAASAVVPAVESAGAAAATPDGEEIDIEGSEEGEEEGGEGEFDEEEEGESLTDSDGEDELEPGMIEHEVHIVTKSGVVTRAWLWLPIENRERPLTAEKIALELDKLGSLGAAANQLMDGMEHLFRSCTEMAARATKANDAETLEQLKLQTLPASLAGRTLVEYQVKDVKESSFRGIVRYHHGFGCDGCGMAPIEGIRYSCQQCKEFDYCANCRATEKHNARHTFKEIEAPVDPDEEDESVNVVYHFAAETGAPMDIIKESQVDQMASVILHFDEFRATGN